MYAWNVALFNWINLITYLHMYKIQHQEMDAFGLYFTTESVFILHMDLIRSIHIKDKFIDLNL